MSERNIRLLIAFDGSAYSGWQRQNNALTIQGELENRLGTMTGSTTILHGAGRTDAGVHARGMVANFKTTSSIPCSGFLAGLNSMLPLDIRILDAQEADNEFHSRYNATGKTYSYSLFTGSVQLPTERLYTAHFPGIFDSDSVLAALQILEGTHDFSSFEAVGSRDTSKAGRGAVRTIFSTELTAHQSRKNTWLLTFSGDGFLRHMVRNIVGTLMEVATGKIPFNDFTIILEGKSRDLAGPTAPACGLVLEKVHYTPWTISP